MAHHPTEPALRPHVRLRLPDGSLAELEHGDLIGRVWSAALSLDDPRISEAHALVSLREGSFWLLALRRRVAVDGVAVSEVRLEPGLRVGLADQLDVVVDEIAVPDTALSLSAEGLPDTVLPAVCSVRATPRPQLAGRYEPDAPCLIWTSGEHWQIRLHGAQRVLSHDDQFTLDGVAFRVRRVALAAAGPQVTLLQGGVHSPLHLVCAYDSVQIHREGEPIFGLAGVQARIVCELASIGAPVSWLAVAREVWPDDSVEASLRKRWDVALARLRARLRAARVRTDLIRADGKGLFELALQRDDRIEDRS